jgi:hypothetical protein
VYEGVAEIESSYWPSASRSQAKEIGSPSGSKEDVPSKLTVRPGGPDVGLASTSASGRRLRGVFISA